MHIVYEFAYALTDSNIVLYGMQTEKLWLIITIVRSDISDIEVEHIALAYTYIYISRFKDLVKLESLIAKQFIDIYMI